MARHAARRVRSSAIEDYTAGVRAVEGDALQHKELNVGRADGGRDANGHGGAGGATPASELVHEVMVATGIIE